MTGNYVHCLLNENENDAGLLPYRARQAPRLISTNSRLNNNNKVLPSTSNEFSVSLLWIIIPSKLSMALHEDGAHVKSHDPKYIDTQSLHHHM
jgi:hypothetical protein